MLPEVGAAELMVIAAIALIVVGPKDLPVLMRKVGRFLAHMRGMAAEFRASFDELARQSELEELRKEVEAMRHAAHQPAAYAAAHVGLDRIENEIGDHLADRLNPPPAAPEDPHAPLPHESEIAVAAAAEASSVEAPAAAPAPEPRP